MVGIIYHLKLRTFFSCYGRCQLFVIKVVVILYLSCHPLTDTWNWRSEIHLTSGKRYHIFFILVTDFRTHNSLTTARLAEYLEHQSAL